MPKYSKLILDTFCEVHDLMSPYADGDFWDLRHHEIIPNATYVIGREQFQSNRDLIIELIQKNEIKVVFSNPAEGSYTMLGQLSRLGILELCRDRKIKILAGGDMEEPYDYLRYDSFQPKLFDYQENIYASSRMDEIYNKTYKPFKFLFLNGRIRSHRKYLIERFMDTGLINESLWSMLDSNSAGSRNLSYFKDGEDLLLAARPHKFLEPYYEIEKYSNRPTHEAYAKYGLFNGEWGEIYLKPEPYIDTYFSLVTETVFDYPFSFRTEKIWKPIVMGHPWVAVANFGFYRDLHNLGYKTFGHLIDESFDTIANHQERIEKVAKVVEDLCSQDLVAYLSATKDIAKYNIERYKEHRQEVRSAFPNTFLSFINNIND